MGQHIPDRLFWAREDEEESAADNASAERPVADARGNH